MAQRPTLRPSILLTSLLSFILTFPSLGHAAGFRIQQQGAAATAQSGAFTAQADDPSAIYYNPAGMTQLRGVQLSLGTNIAGGDTTFRSLDGSSTATGNFGGSVLFPPPSQFYLTANLQDLGITSLGDLSAGLGVISPFGILYEWPDSGPFNTAVTFAALELADIKPTLAYKLNDQLSFGVGADIYTFFDFWGEGQAEIKFISSGGPGLPPAGTPIEINGSDTAAGFNVSVLYTPFRTADKKPLVNVGLVYRSQVTLQLDGQFLAGGTLVADSSTTLVLPQVITGGIALWPVRDAAGEWKLEVDIDYTGWKSHRNLDLRLSTGQNIPVPRDWESTFTVMIGTEYKWLRPAPLPDWEVALRGGYAFSQAPGPDRTFTPDVPDADNHSLSFGLGLVCKDRGRLLGLIECGRTGESRWHPEALGLDFAFQTILYEARSVTGNQQPFAIPGVVDGEYKTTFYIGSVSLTARF